MRTCASRTWTSGAGKRGREGRRSRARWGGGARGEGREGRRRPGVGQQLGGKEGEMRGEPGKGGRGNQATKREGLKGLCLMCCESGRGWFREEKTHGKKLTLIRGSCKSTHTATRGYYSKGFDTFLYRSLALKNQWFEHIHRVKRKTEGSRDRPDTRETSSLPVPHLNPHPPPQRFSSGLVTARRRYRHTSSRPSRFTALVTRTGVVSFN